MSREVSRRTFLRGSLATAAAVVGFDTVLRGWVSAADADFEAARLIVGAWRRAFT